MNFQTIRETPIFKFISFALAVSILLLLFAMFPIKSSAETVFDFSSFANAVDYSENGTLNGLPIVNGSNTYASLFGTMSPDTNLYTIVYYSLLFQGNVYYLYTNDTAHYVPFFAYRLGSIKSTEARDGHDDLNISYYVMRNNTSESNDSPWFYSMTTTAISYDNLSPDDIKVGSVTYQGINNAKYSVEPVVTQDGNYVKMYTSSGDYLVSVCDSIGNLVDLSTLNIEQCRIVPFMVNNINKSQLNSFRNFDFMKSVFISEEGFVPSSPTNPDNTYDISAHFNNLLEYGKVDNQHNFNMMDFISLGYQYPILDFGIFDNGNGHKYSLRISDYSGAVEGISQMFDDRSLFESSTKLVGYTSLVASALAIKTAVSTGAIFLGGVGAALAFLPIGAESNMQGNLHHLFQLMMIQDLGNRFFDTKRVLSSDVFDFSNSNNVGRQYKVNLQDYFTLLPYVIYRIEVIDNTDNRILNSAYFSVNKQYAKSDSGMGTQVYKYDDKDKYDDDKNEGEDYRHDDYENANPLTPDNPLDIGPTYPNSPSTPQVSDIFGNLNSMASQLTGFFNAVWNIIPTPIMTIIVSAIALLIIMRILGR